MQNRKTLHIVEQVLGSTLRETTSNTQHRLLNGRCSDTLDEARWSEEAAVAVQELDIDWTTKKQARAALDRLQAGKYGICESCERAIPKERLVALPWATRCVRCAALREYSDHRQNDELAASLRDLLDLHKMLNVRLCLREPGNERTGSRSISVIPGFRVAQVLLDQTNA